MFCGMLQNRFANSLTELIVVLLKRFQTQKCAEGFCTNTLNELKIFSNLMQNFVSQTTENNKKYNSKKREVGMEYT